MPKKFFLTTAIDYANGSPHLGHAYEKILADVISRYQTLRGHSVHFLTGLDEHGQKVQQSAQKNNTSPQTYCDSMAVLFKNMCNQLDIRYHDYIRTTESRHKAVVTQLLRELFEKGEIYKADYKGFYSTRQEQFLQEKDRNENGQWPEIFGEVVELTESNYFFKLSKYQDWLIEYIQQNENFISPKFRTKQVLEFLKDPLNDLCISRPIERLNWGIPLPFDPNFVTYVWFDALLNYISAVKFGTDEFKNFWPADLQIIGKDILCPPHAVYWPIMLKACGIPLPKKLLVHGWWTVNGEKMSKSIGNIINPLEVANQFGADALRYFLIREMTIGQDANFSLELFNIRYNSDLANDLGNLVSRLQNMVSRYTDNKIPNDSLQEEPEEELQNLWKQTHESIFELGDNFQFNLFLEKIFNFIRGINRYTDTRSPWKLAKSADSMDRQRLETALATMSESLRLASIILIPVIPATATKILSFLGLKEINSFSNQFAWSKSLQGNTIGEKVILFPKLNTEVADTSPSNSKKL